ncbi:alpha/beta family hydrolase [Ancylobacter terrae]|uniref:alpha/beta family hydrolase n=1 Tax=Ancylobacter sp. sgz301288 TaxID=3342077 RepID=UPI003859E28C
MWSAFLKSFARIEVKYPSAGDAPVILVIGRRNVGRNSALINRVLADLHGAGAAIYELEWRKTRVVRQMDADVGRLSAAELFRRCPAGTRSGRLLRRLLTLGLLARHPSWWPYYLHERSSSNALTARMLTALLRDFPPGRVCLLSHSLGGIVASMAQSAPAVSRLICFGYPFRHPARGEEPVRTRHLAGVTKPFLILQGERDPYGNAAAAGRYALSSTIRVLPVDADHDYGMPEAEAYDRVFRAISAVMQTAPAAAE